MITDAGCSNAGWNKKKYQLPFYLFFHQPNADTLNACKRLYKIQTCASFSPYSYHFPSIPLLGLLPLLPLHTL